MNLFEKSENFESHSNSKSSLTKAGKTSEDSLSEISNSLNSSITSECQPNHKINESISFNNLYFSENRNKENMNPISSNKLKRLNHQVSVLSQQVQNSNLEIKKLQNKMNLIQKENIIKLQFMQEQHEKKLRKNKQDLDFLLNDLNLKSTAIIAQEFLAKHNQEIEAQKNYYSGLLQEIKEKHESQISSKEKEKSAFCNFILKRLLNSIENKDIRSTGGMVLIRFDNFKQILDDIRHIEAGAKDTEYESCDDMSTFESDREKKSITIQEKN
jgi:hypothetical protein